MQLNNLFLKLLSDLKPIIFQLADLASFPNIFDFAILSSASAASLDFSLTVNRKPLTMFFILVFVDLLRMRLFSFWRARFTADL